MTLTGIAKEHFEIWLSRNQSEGLKKFKTSVFYTYDNIHKNAYYVAWFDSVGIYIDTHLFPHFDESEIISVCWYVNIATSYECYNSDDNYPSRTEATIHAITEANKIYNEKI